MLMEMNLEINKKRIINSCILLVITILYIILFILKIEIPCMFKSIFGISCPGCGMTRAIKELLNLNFIGAFSYNILAVPLALMGSVSIIVIIYDIIKNSDIFIRTVNKVFTKYWYIVIVLIIISMIVNNIK